MVDPDLPHVPYGPAWWNEPAPVVDASAATDFITRGVADQTIHRGPRCNGTCEIDHQYVLIRKWTDENGFVFFYMLDAHGIYNCDARLYHQQRPPLTRIEVYRDYVGTMEIIASGDSVEYLCPLLNEIMPFSEVQL